MKIQTMHEAYRGLLFELFHSGTREINARTGVGIVMLEGGHSFKIDLANGLLPVAGNRKYWPKVAAAETAWQLMGTQDPTFILAHAPKLWSKFVENGELKTAYGYRWRHHFGRDQLDLAIDELMANPTNRQLYISAWDPATDGLGGPQPKNIPCPVGFSLTRTSRKIHCSVFIRSSDVFVGLPYDVMGYAYTLDAIAASCGVKPGTFHVTLAHPHYYDPHAEAVEACLDGEHSEWTRGVEPPLPSWTCEEILADPGAYVGLVSRQSRNVEQSDWDATPELVV